MVWVGWGGVGGSVGVTLILRQVSFQLNRPTEIELGKTLETQTYQNEYK